METLPDKYTPDVLRNANVPCLADGYVVVYDIEGEDHKLWVRAFGPVADLKSALEFAPCNVALPSTQHQWRVLHMEHPVPVSSAPSKCTQLYAWDHAQSAWLRLPA
jgi:hypothetical protein